MDVLIGSLVLALLCMVCGANFMALTLLGDHYKYRDLWRAWRLGSWPTLERLASARQALAREQQRNEDLQRRLRDLVDRRDGRRPMARVREAVAMRSAKSVGPVREPAVSDEGKSFADLGRALLTVLDADGRDVEDPVEYLRDRLREHGEFQDEIFELGQQLEVALAKGRLLELPCDIPGVACPQTSESESLQRPAPNPTQPYTRKDG